MNTNKINLRWYQIMSTTVIEKFYNDPNYNLNNEATINKELNLIDISFNNFLISRKKQKLSYKILRESALFIMIKELIEHRDQINIINSVLSINAYDLDLVQKLNYYIEFLAHIPFLFKYNKTQAKILLDLFHLEEEVDLKTNLEL